MKQRTRLIQAALLAMSSFSFLAGCDAGNEIVGIHMANPETISVYYGNFAYDGIKVDVELRNGKTVQVDLSDEMVSEVERLKFFKVGEQTVEVVYHNKFKTTMPVNVVLNQFYDSYQLVGYECVYDGNPHMVSLNQELPEGASITYPTGNIFTNAGVYNVTGVISKKGYESKTLTTTLTITPAERKADDILFQDVTVIYDGETHTIEAKNVPEDIKVEYDYYDYEHGYDVPVTKINNAGKYRIVARFIDSSSNYKKIPDKEAILTIEKARYDTRKVDFKDHTKTFDGLSYEAEKSISGLDSLPGNLRGNVTFTYLNEAGDEVLSNKDVGTYTMVAHFGGIDTLNYYPIEDMTATLTVAKAVVSIKDLVAFNGITADFDPNVTRTLKVTDPKDPEKDANLPEGIKVEYINNGQTYAGEHEVKAVFTCEDPNKTPDISELTAYIVINRIRDSVKFVDGDGKFTKAFSFKDNVKINGNEASVFGFNPEVFKLKQSEIKLDEETTVSVNIAFFDADNQYVAPQDLVVYTEENHIVYTYLVAFEYIDENMNNSVLLSQESDTFRYDGLGA